MLRNFIAKRIERILDRYAVNMKAEEDRLSAAGATVVTNDQYAVLKSLDVGDMIRLNGKEHPVTLMKEWGEKNEYLDFTFKDGTTLNILTDTAHRIRYHRHVPHRFLFFKGTRGITVPIVSLEIPALGFRLKK